MPPLQAAKAVAENEDLISRKFRRTVYDFEAWEKHRKVQRYFINIATMPSSRIIRDLLTPLSAILGFGALFGTYETLIDMHLLPAYFHSLQLAKTEPWGVTSFAVSLLLVFRTNSSYGRFDEARKIWGTTLNRARTMATLTVAYIPASDTKGRVAMAKWMVGFVQALRAHLQSDANLRLELSKCTPAWTQEEIDLLCNSQHKPMKALNVMSETIRQLQGINPLQAVQIQDQISQLHDQLGGCERLLRTPIPLSYTRHTARFLCMWLATLPVGLWGTYHWSSLFVTGAIGLLLLGIDEIGMQIEEPFGILPLDSICNRAMIDINSALKDDDGVRSYVTDSLAEDEPAFSQNGLPGYSYSNNGSLVKAGSN